MKKILIITTLIAFPFISQAQFDQAIAEKKTKKEIKEEKRKERQKAAAGIKNFVEAKEFVLEANMLFDRYGQSRQVAGNINFVMVNDEQATIQIGSAHSIGWNGVGGITIQGKITNYDVKLNKRKDNVTLSYHVLSNIGNFDVRLNVNASGNATAQIRDNRGGFLRYSGSFESLSSSNAYVGNRTF